MKPTAGNIFTLSTFTGQLAASLRFSSSNSSFTYKFVLPDTVLLTDSIYIPDIPAPSYSNRECIVYGNREYIV